jgi:SAM-dependent methyltransferase
MFRDAILVEEEEEPETAIVLKLSRIFDLDSDPINNLRIRRMFRSQVHFDDGRIRVESAQFLDRVRSSGHEIADKSRDTYESARTLGAGVPRYSWLLDYIPRVLPCETAFTANVRFRNIGSVSLSHKPPGQIRICAFWYNEVGEKMAAPDLRTPLPLDVPPGRELTLPISTQTPNTTGYMRLQLTMVQEGVRFLHDDSKCIRIKLNEVPKPALPEGWARHEAPPLNYRDDHSRGQELFSNWLSARKVDRPRVLEIGGNAHPTAAGLAGVELYNLDVDLFGLQVATMVRRAGGQEIVCVCADAEDLPFPPGYFDAVVFFAALHHFPDPARLLSHVATRLRAGGFIGVFCEPVGHIDPSAVDPVFLAELRKGVNEQSFAAAEYGAIFSRARLKVEEAIIDFNSLKARLVPLE